MTWSEEQGKKAEELARQGTIDQGLTQNLGSYGQNFLQGGSNPHLYRPSDANPSQSVAERLGEQRQDYYYGGYKGGAADAAAEARGAVNPYSTGLYGYGASFAEQSGAAQGRVDPMAYGGTQSVYSTAGNLAGYARQGPGPSVAQAQLEANNAQALRAQASLAGSGRGMGGGASAMRAAQANQALMSGQANAQASVLQAQEAQNWRQAQLQAMGMSGQLYDQGAGLALQQAQQNDQYGLGMAGLANQSMQQGGMLALGQENLVNSINQSALQGSMGYESGLNQIYGIQQGVSTASADREQREDAANLQFYGSLLAAASDIRAKKNIRPADDEVTATLRRLGVEHYDAPAPDREVRRVPNLAEQFSADTGLGTPVVDWRTQRAQLERDGAFAQRKGTWRRPELIGVQRGGPLDARREQAAAAYMPTVTGEGGLSDYRARARAANAPNLRDTTASTFEYKDPARHGEGTYVGPMAHELESLPGVVHEQPDGTKAIDTGRAALVGLSAAGEQQRTTDDLDERLGRIEGLLDASEDKPAAKPKAKPKAKKTVPKLTDYERRYAAEMAEERNAPTEYERRYLEEMAEENRPSEIEKRYARELAEEGRPVSPIAGRKGRNIPMRNLDEPSGSSARAPRGTQFSDELSQEEQDELEREFYNPSERYRTYRL